MPRRRDVLIAYKLLFGLLGFSALVTEIATLVERDAFVGPNFFSYFTIQSNILVVIALILSAVAVAGRADNHRDHLRAAVVVYIFVVGLGFALLLAGLEGVQFTAVGWDNVVLHYLMPVAMLVDYLIDRPRRKIGFGRGLIWLLYPIAYVAYSLIRGEITGWYPYPFLDPGVALRQAQEAGFQAPGAGYAAVALTALGLLVLGVALVWIVTKMSGAEISPADASASQNDRRVSRSPS